MMRSVRIFSGYFHTFLLSALLLFLSGAAAWYVRHMSEDFSNVLDSNVASVRAAEELEIALREVQNQLRLNGALLRGDPKKALELIASLKKETDKWLKSAEDAVSTEYELKMMAEIRPGYDHFFKELHIAVQRPHVSYEAKFKVRALIDNILMKEIIPPVHSYLDFNEAAMAALVKQQRMMSHLFSLAVLGIGICGSVGGFLIGLYASRRLKKSLVELNLPLSITAGRLSEIVGPIRLSTRLDLAELKNVLDIIAVEAGRVVERLHKSQQDVLHAEKLAAIGQLAAGIAHEIRNPMMAIKLLVQSARLSPDSPITAADFEVIELEIERVEKTVRNLLDFAKPPAIARTKVALKDLIQQCVHLVVGKATMQGIQIITDLKEQQATVEGDYHQLQQVVMNLLMNALDSTPKGGKITIALERDVGEPMASEYVKIVVSDNGLGIPDDLLPTAFEPFVSNKVTGTGLGLSISKQIVEAHHGQIFAANPPCGGAKVWFILPASNLAFGNLSL